MSADLVRRALALVRVSTEHISDAELAEIYAPDVVIDMSARVFNPRVYEGYDGLREYGADLVEVWDDVTFEPVELVEEGDGRIRTASRMRGHGRGSRVPIDEVASVVWTVADGRIVHVRFDG